jgi:hypothetical protein
LFSCHGFFERIFHEKLRASAGVLFTSIDTNVTGSKIYGATPNAEYSPTFAQRQTGDVGYYGLTGGTRMKQYIGNLNVFYQPAKYWIVRPGVKYEHLRTDGDEGHTDTDFGGGAAAAAIQRQIESDFRFMNRIVRLISLAQPQFWLGMSMKDLRNIVDDVHTMTLVELDYQKEAGDLSFFNENNFSERTSRSSVKALTWRT